MVGRYLNYNTKNGLNSTEQGLTVHAFGNCNSKRYGHVLKQKVKAIAQTKFTKTNNEDDPQILFFLIFAQDFADKISWTNQFEQSEKLNACTVSC